MDCPSLIRSEVDSTNLERLVAIYKQVKGDCWPWVVKSLGYPVVINTLAVNKQPPSQHWLIKLYTHAKPNRSEEQRSTPDGATPQN